MQSYNNWNTTYTNIIEQTLTQEEKMNEEIMSEKKTTLPSLRNQHWKKVKAETEKINQLLTYISMNNIMELNKLINAEAKLVFLRICASLKNTNRYSKPEWETRLETQIRNLWQQAKMIRQRKNAGIWWDEKRK